MYIILCMKWVDARIRVIPPQKLLLIASTSSAISASGLGMKQCDSLYQVAEGAILSDIAVQAYITSNPDKSSPILHLIWRFVSPSGYSVPAKYFASVQSLPIDNPLSTISTLQIVSCRKFNSLTGVSETMISLVCVYSLPTETDDDAVTQWSFFRIKLYPFEDLEDEQDAGIVLYTDITSLITTNEGDNIEVIDLSKLLSLSQPSSLIIQQRSLPSGCMSVGDFLYAPTRGVSALLLTKKVGTEGVLIYDMEENEEEGEEDENDQDDDQMENKDEDMNEG